MIFLVIALLLAAVGLPLWVFGPHYPDQTEYGTAKRAGVALSVIAGLIFVFAVLLPTGVIYSNRIGTMEAYRQSFRVESIYERKADSLIDQFRSVLVEKYPQYEAEAFDKISDAGDLTAFLVAYPELRTVDALNRYVSEVGKLRSRVYDEQVKREGYIATLRTQERSPWLITGLLPGFDEDAS